MVNKLTRQVNLRFTIRVIFVASCATRSHDLRLFRQGRRQDVEYITTVWPSPGSRLNRREGDMMNMMRLMAIFVGLFFVVLP